MMVLFTLALMACGCGLGDGLPDRVVEESIDLIELNHFYDPCGRHVYDQVIFYHLSPETGKYRVRAWCLVEDRETLSRRPLKDPSTGIVRVEWYDGDHKVIRRLESHIFRESWTQVDPERMDKRHLDERHRLSLVQGPQRVAAERQMVAEMVRAEERPSEESGPASVGHVSNPIYVAVGGRR
ncbi:MAG: hypothetical protein MUF23_17760 [Pirellula sp.]|jgi:hypothetical protein|nr:hypothetical protein [Pirellula sp.]